MDIQLKNIEKYYGNHKVLDDLNIYVPSGQVYGFIGANGAGKTTTMKIWKFLIPIALITITCNAASFTLQLTAHFWIQTAMSAIAFSALLVILPVFLGKSILMTRVIPLLSISYPVTSPTFSSVTCSLLSIWAAAFSLTISLVTAKKFHL